MAVVINEFEIVAEPAPQPAPPAPTEAPAAGRAGLPAQEVARVLQHEAERALRIWAS